MCVLGVPKARLSRLEPLLAGTSCWHVCSSRQMAPDRLPWAQLWPQSMEEETPIHLPALPAGSLPGSSPAGLACVDMSPGSLSAPPGLALLLSVFCSGHLFPGLFDAFLLLNCLLLYQIVAAEGKNPVPFALCCFST